MTTIKIGMNKTSACTITHTIIINMIRFPNCYLLRAIIKLTIVKKLWCAKNTCTYVSVLIAPFGHCLIFCLVTMIICGSHYMCNKMRLHYFFGLKHVHLGLYYLWTIWRADDCNITTHFLNKRTVIYPWKSFQVVLL